MLRIQATSNCEDKVDCRTALKLIGHVIPGNLVSHKETTLSGFISNKEYIIFTPNSYYFHHRLLIILSKLLAISLALA